jgi:hypothetical protein
LRLFSSLQMKNFRITSRVYPPLLNPDYFQLVRNLAQCQRNYPLRRTWLKAMETTLRQAPEVWIKKVKVENAYGRRVKDPELLRGLQVYKKAKSSIPIWNVDLHMREIEDWAGSRHPILHKILPGGVADES